MEKQRYPDLRDSEGHPIAPYDVTAHTLPLLMGVEVKEVYAPSGGKLVPFSQHLIYAIFSTAIKSPGRYAVYKSNVPSMDEGWTRWVLESNFSSLYSTLKDDAIRAGNLRAKYDTIVIPDQPARTILEGYRKGSMPAELTGGLGHEGVEALREFVEAGGTLVCLNKASDFAIEQLKLPVRDITEGLKRTDFFAPGSILRTELDLTHPVAAGMPRESIAWVENSPVFEISDPKEAGRVRVIARYPADRDPLLSGWLMGGERLRGKAALVEVTSGRGRVILFGFRPQYRGQALATYKLFFNSIERSRRTP
jgi:hypothetical protein